MSQEFIHYFNVISNDVHITAMDKGWWEDRDRLINEARTVSADLGDFAEKAVFGMAVALCHSELSEALEGERKDLPSDHIPSYTMAEEEFADVIIRIMDYASHHGLRVAQAVIAKSKYNKTRPTKPGGKKF